MERDDRDDLRDEARADDLAGARASSRRRFLRTVLALPFALAGAVHLGLPTEAAAAEALLAASSGAPREHADMPPTPDCGDDDEPTPAETAGPFFSPGSPQRTSLIEAGMKGTRLVVSGRVVTRGCRPVAGALLDFWQADDAGNYDNEGFRLRGHQFADRDGRFRLETIVPGVYPGRTRHIHVRVQAPRGRVLTTQLYFPGEPRNRTDGLFRRDLLLAIREGTTPRDGRFHFVLEG